MKIILKIVFLIIFSGIVPEMSAIDFKVDSFRLLPNDVSAFINPVKDLNDEDCALIKVTASEDFAFSTPLGIVKRIDNTGEIWLYIPRKSKKITIKHPQYGVLRDFSFPEKIESHLTYELRIDEPRRISETAISQSSLPVLTRDTLILTVTDTVTMVKTPEPVPFSFSASAVYTVGGCTASSMYGIMLTAMRRHGGYLHVASDFGKKIKTGEKCDKEGYIDGYLPFYAAGYRNRSFMVSAGGIHRITKFLNVFEGIGYGCNRRFWRKADSEGGGYVENQHYSYSGVLIEVGVNASLRRWLLSAAVASVEGSQWFASLGLGYKF